MEDKKDKLQWQQLNRKELSIISIKIMLLELIAELFIMKAVLPPLELHIPSAILDYLDPLLLVMFTTPLIMIIITGPYIRGKNELVKIEKELMERYQKENRDLKIQKNQPEELTKHENTLDLDGFRHHDFEKIELTGSLISPATYLVRYLLNFLNLEFQFEEISFLVSGNISKDWSGVTLKVHQSKLTDLAAICRYIEARKKSDLQSKSLIQRARVDQYMSFILSDIYHPLLMQLADRFHLPLPSDVFKQEVSQVLDRMHARLSYFDSRLKKSNYLLGRQISLADFVLLASLDPSELCLIDLNQYEHIVLWRKKLIQESFYQSCHSGYSRSFIQVMESYRFINQLNSSQLKSVGVHHEG